MSNGDLEGPRTEGDWKEVKEHLRKIREIKVLRTDLTLESCGQPETKQPDVRSHEQGCYIRFKQGVPVHTEERSDCIVDYDENGKIIGIEFFDGLHEEITANDKDKDVYEELFIEYKKEKMKNMHPDYEKWGIIEENWKNDILPWIKKATEQLRQEIIDDLTSIYNDSSMLTLPFSLSPGEIQKIINRRFGVKP